MRRWLRSSIRVATLLLVASAAIADPLLGSWERSMRDEDDLLREEAVERATAPLSVVYRGLVRAILRANLDPAERWHIAAEDDSIAVAADGEPLEFALWDGRTTTTEGDALTREQHEGALVLHWRHGPGTYGSTRWEISEDGNVLAVRSTLVEHRIGPDPIEFTTHYRRSASE